MSNHHHHPPPHYSLDSYSRSPDQQQDDDDNNDVDERLRASTSTHTPPPAAPPLKIKRKRGALACLDCRARKRKCDGRPYGAPDDFTPEDPTSGKLRNGVKEGWGPCRQCLESSIACRWPERDKRRRQDDASGADSDVQQQEIKRARTSGVEALLAASRAQSPVAPTLNAAFSQDLQDFFATLEQAPPSSAVRFEQQPPPPPAPTEDVRLSYEYLRPYGPTAINPGLGRVKLSIRTKRPTLTTFRVPTELPLVDPSTQLPSPHVRPSLLDAFYRHFGSMFPFSQRSVIDSKVRDAPDGRTALLVNSMCALSARFCDHPDILASSDMPFCRGTQFADTAKRLLTPLLEMPSPDTCASLLYLAYYGLGVNSEAAEWMYAGMALRMATDLGLQRRVAMRGGRSTRSHDKLLFWSIFALDRYLSIGVGRPSHVPDHHIDTPEPDPEHDAGATPAFAAVVRLARIQGRIADLVNASPHWLGSLATESGRNSRRPSPERDVMIDHRKITTPIGDPSFREELEQLSRLEAEIIHAYECLPPELQWSAKT